MSAKKTHKERLQVRWLIGRDMPEVLEIENRSFEFPWTHEEFLICLRQRNCIGCVAEMKTGGAIHGFMIYELHRKHLVLKNLAVAPEVRRTTVGRTMIERLIDKLSQQRRACIVAEVSDSNSAGQIFLAKCGFTATGVDEENITFQYVMEGCFPEWQSVNRIAKCFK